MSPMFGERALKSPLYGIGHIPDGIAEMEQAVCRLNFPQRYLIVQRWQRHRSYRQLAKLVGVGVWRVSRLLKSAEEEVNIQLDVVYLLQTTLDVTKQIWDDTCETPKLRLYSA